MKRIFTLLATALLAVSALSGQELTNFARGGNGPRIVSPEVKDGKVTFRLSANYATRVQLSGNWMENPWTGSIDMAKGEGGVWEVTIDAPEPEIYTYNFIVDGVSVNDPLNDKVQRDGTRYLNMLTATRRTRRLSILSSTSFMVAAATRKPGPPWAAPPRSWTTSSKRALRSR